MCFLSPSSARMYPFVLTQELLSFIDLSKPFSSNDSLRLGSLTRGETRTTIGGLVSAAGMN